MLDYNAASANAKILAIHYANRIGDAELVQFMSGDLDIGSAELAD